MSYISLWKSLSEVKIGRFWIFHHLKCITSSKDSENLETYPGTWICSWVCHGNHWMCSGTLSEITVCENSSPCHPQMQVKALSCKDDAICKYNPETLLSSLGLRLKQSGNLFCGQTHWNFKLFLKIMDAAFSTKEESDHPAYHERSVQKLPSLVVWACNNAKGPGRKT